MRLDREGPSPVTPFVRGNKVAVFNKEADLVFAQSNRTLAPVVGDAGVALAGAWKCSECTVPGRQCAAASVQAFMKPGGPQK